MPTFHPPCASLYIPPRTLGRSRGLRRHPCRSSERHCLAQPLPPRLGGTSWGFARLPSLTAATDVCGQPKPERPRTRCRFAPHDGLGILHYRIVVDSNDGLVAATNLENPEKSCLARPRPAQAPEKKRRQPLQPVHSSYRNPCLTSAQQTSTLYSERTASRKRWLESNYITPPFLSLHGNDMPLVVRRQPFLSFVSGVSTCFPAISTACPLLRWNLGGASPGARTSARKRAIPVLHWAAAEDSLSPC